MNEISKFLTEPESKTLEFKKDLSSMQPILKTIVAFANTSGGTLIIGVAPDKEVIGLSDIFKSEEMLANAIADSISPILLPEIEVATIYGKNLLIVKVCHWKAPFYIKNLGNIKGVFIRLGSTSRPADPDMILELKRSVINQSYDQQAILELSCEAIDFEKVRDTFSHIHKEIDKKKLRSLGVLVASNHEYSPSIGGLILFGKKEFREDYFPDARVKCARFQGKDKTNILDQYEIEGTILDAVDEVPKFIARNTRLGMKIQNLRRKEIPEYSEIALREILINALAHADYSIRGSTIQVAIFDDRLDIQNPGMLPFGFTMEDLKAGVSRVRNRVIAKVFHALKLMEEWGSGYKRVIEACQQNHYPEPEWVEQGTSMRVTLFSQNKFRPKSPAVPDKEISERQKLILALFKKDQSLPFRIIYKDVPFKISERMLRYELAQLKKKGLLISQGRGPSTSWKKASNVQS